MVMLDGSTVLMLQDPRQLKTGNAAAARRREGEERLRIASADVQSRKQRSSLALTAS